MRIYARTEERAVMAPWQGGPEAREVVPGGVMASYVESVSEGWEEFGVETVERVLPDGAVHVFFEVGDVVRAVAAGSGTAPVTLRFRGRLEHVGVRLRPGAVAAVLGAPAGDVAGREVALSELWGEEAWRVLERVRRARRGERIGVVMAAVKERLARVEGAPERRVAAAVRNVIARRGGVRVREIAEGVGVGERRLETMFRKDVGLSPKALCRVTRMRAAIDHVHGKRVDWGEAALACGFYDQAHMINEFRELTGATPGELSEVGFFQAANS